MESKNLQDEFPSEIPLEPVTQPIAKKRRGRPKGSKNKVQSPKKVNVFAANEPTPNDVEFDLLENKAAVTDIFTTNCIKYVFHIIATITDNEVWDISDKEAKEIYKGFADALAKLPKSRVNKYKKLFDNYTPFIQLAIILVAIIYPRYVITKQLKDANGYKPTELDKAINEFERDSATKGNQGAPDAATTDSTNESGVTERNTDTISNWLKEYGNGKGFSGFDGN